MKHLTLITSLTLVLSCLPARAEEPTASTAQLVGTVRNERWCWNPFWDGNNMAPDPAGGFTSILPLSKTGGRNQDGIYAIRFFTDQKLRNVYKKSKEPGKLITGPESAFAGNILFRVPETGDYRIHFDPKTASYSITPPVERLIRIDSMQINGFVHDKEGGNECFDGRRTRPAEKWDEWLPSHELAPGKDNSWVIKLPLSATGGHERNGVYQCLLSANNNSDWGYSAILGKPGKLAGGNGYDSRVGHIEETALVFRVKQDAEYTLTVYPDQYRFEITPPVEFFQHMEFQVDGDVVPDPWNPEAPSHDMRQEKDGLWHKTLTLSRNGGTNGNGLYTMNFSIDGNWALDSIGYGGKWGSTWHSDPQEWNLLFRVPADGAYNVTLDPVNGTFAFNPPVEPITTVESLQIAGNFEAFAADGKEGWNPLLPMHDMETKDKQIFTKDLRLTAGMVYNYKYTANRAGWAWSLVDYPYDGYRRLAPHGNPPPLRFECPRDGDYRFTADLRTGEYNVYLIRHR